MKNLSTYKRKDCTTMKNNNNVKNFSSYRLIDFPTFKKKAAFTLAEVLITLGIIGVVAALTIPALMTKLENDRHSAILKEDYSILQQMMISANEEGAMAIDTYNNLELMKEWFKTYFLPYIKVNNVCYDEWGCWSKNVKTAAGTIYTTNTACGVMSVSFSLYNGSYVCMDDFDDSRFGVNLDGKDSQGLLIDVNGDKKPNMIGKDIFAVVFKDDKLLPGGYDMDDATIDNNCSTKCTTTSGYTNVCGTNCTVKAQRRGFKLPVLNN